MLIGMDIASLYHPGGVFTPARASGTSFEEDFQKEAIYPFIYTEMWYFLNTEGSETRIVCLQID
jgi:hypothetical protein